MSGQANLVLYSSRRQSLRKFPTVVASPVLARWESKIHLGEQFFNEIITNPIPLDLNILKRLKRSPLGLDLYLWLTYRTFGLTRPLLYRQFGGAIGDSWCDPVRACSTPRQRVIAFMHLPW